MRHSPAQLRRFRLARPSAAVLKRCPSDAASILLVLLGAERHPLRSLPLSFPAGFTLQMYLFVVKLNAAFQASLQDEKFAIEYDGPSTFNLKKWWHKSILPDDADKIKSMENVTYD
jgi:hypothetical protein